MDKTTDFISEIESVDSISLDQSFRIIAYCTQLLSQHSAEAELSARKFPGVWTVWTAVLAPGFIMPVYSVETYQRQK